jgi:septum formation protein
MAPRVVLASASPRRRTLLRYLIADFEVIPSTVDERFEPGPLIETVARLAEVKARAVTATLSAGIVLGADTVVVIDDEPLGKPADSPEAVAMLRRLRGRPHEVLTGVAVLDVGSGRAFTATEVTRVVMARFTDELIERYVASGAPLDKAGGYAIQDLDGALVDGVFGSFTNVIGLPLGLTARLLRQAGVPVSAPGWS